MDIYDERELLREELDGLRHEQDAIAKKINDVSAKLDALNIDIQLAFSPQELIKIELGHSSLTAERAG